MTQSVYAIGDVHGDLDQLDTMLNQIEKDRADNTVDDFKAIFIGDLVDRRENSKGVIDRLLNGLESGNPWVVLKGNHDRLFAMFLRSPEAADPILRPDYTWLHPRMGGRETLESYGVVFTEDKPLAELHKEAVAAVPERHLQFLETLPLTWENDRYFFCHAGVNPQKPLDAQTEDELVWIRAPFHDWTEPFPKIIVHGHTPIDEVTHYGNRINIDTGAAWGHRLSAIVLEDDLVFEIGKTGRIPLTQSSP